MSRVNFGAKPVMYPMPVLIIATYDENGVPDAMNAAWGIITDMNEISISMSEHKTTENLAKTGAFTVSIGTEDTVVAATMWAWNLRRKYLINSQSPVSMQPRVILSMHR